MCAHSSLRWALSGLLGLPVLAMSQTAASTDRPELKPGDQWEYRVLDGWNDQETDRFTVTFERQEGERLIYQRKGPADAEPRTVRADLDQNTCVPRLDSDQETCAVSLKFPIAMGQTAAWDKYPLASREGHTQAKCTVAGRESIKVPAGTFDTWRIDCRGFWNHRSGNSGGLSLSAWYAPQVARNARVAVETRLPNGAPNIKSVTELVSYSLVPR